MESAFPKILATVVTYNPDVEVLGKRISCLERQVDFIQIYDNGSRNQNEFFRFNNETIQVVANAQNVGLPKNYNHAIEFALNRNFDYLLILDQDSEFDENFIREYKENISDDFVAFVPRIVYDNSLYENKYGKPEKEKSEIADEIINSGLLLNLKMLPRELRFDEDFFIDCVDFDFFEKAKTLEKKLLRINTAVLKVHLGSICRKGPFFLYNYSPFRLQKQMRDRIVFIRKHGFAPKSIWLFFFALANNLKILLFECSRWRKMNALVKGFVEGVSVKVKSR